LLKHREDSFIADGQLSFLAPFSLRYSSQGDYGIDARYGFVRAGCKNLGIPMVVSLIVLLVLFCVEEVPSHQAQMFAGRALMVRSINSLFEADAAVELKVDDFNTMLWAMPASSAIVEFFAHW